MIDDEQVNAQVNARVPRLGEGIERGVLRGVAKTAGAFSGAAYDATEPSYDASTARDVIRKLFAELHDSLNANQKVAVELNLSLVGNLPPVDKGSVAAEPFNAPALLPEIIKALDMMISMSRSTLNTQRLTLEGIG